MGLSSDLRSIAVDSSSLEVAIDSSSSVAVDLFVTGSSLDRNDFGFNLQKNFHILVKDYLL